MEQEKASRQIDPGVAVAIEAAGGRNKLADLLGIRGESISGWRRVPAERVLEIERVTEGRASRTQMRPDLYPQEEAA